MRLLQLDDLMTSYTNARPEAGLLVVDGKKAVKLTGNALSR